MRVALGGIFHETNTFCTGVTPIDAFYREGWEVGPEIIENHRSVRDYQGGVIDACERLGFELVPAFFATTTPSATIDGSAFAEMEDLLLTRLRECGEIDGVCLTLHGAGVAEGVYDIEGHITARVREQYGPDVPIVVTHDLHANVFQESLDNADAVFGVNFYPHTDAFERGVEAIEALARIRNGEIQPTMHLTQVPILLPAAPTDLSPAKDINEMCWDWEKHDDVLDCTFFHGFGRADIPRAGVSVLTITDNDPEKAMRIGNEIGRAIWERREHFRRPMNSPQEAFAKAMEDDGRPVIINERSDNPSGGSPGDGTHLLRAMLEARLQDACFGFICDPETVEQAHDAGVGAVISIRLGAKSDNLHGEPIETTAYVKCLTDGKFRQQSPMFHGRKVDLGRMARVVIHGVDVLVSSVRAQTFDDEVFRLHGIDVRRYKIVAIKSAGHFRAAFAPLAHKIVQADTPGLTTDIPLFEFKRLQRPIWPLDEGMSWQ